MNQDALLSPAIAAALALLLRQEAGELAGRCAFLLRSLGEAARLDVLPASGQERVLRLALEGANVLKLLADELASMESQP